MSRFAFDVLRDSFDHLAAEMAVELKKVAYSPIIREAGDFATGFTDGEGRLVARAAYTPGHYNSIALSTKEVMRSIGREHIRPGDVLITNDPWMCASHLPDIFIYTPLFVEDRLFAVVASGAHHIDIGGKNPGGTTADTTELFQEGLQIPPLKLREEGRLNTTIEQIVRANVRLPDVVWNDIRACMAINDLGAARLHWLVQKYGAAQVEDAFAETMRRSEELLRAEIERIPDGEFHWEDVVDDDGIGDEPVKIAVTLRIEGSDVVIDLAGSAPQVRSGINLAPPFRDAYAAVAVRCFVDPRIPHNEGALRPIRVVAPPGTIVNPEKPAPVAGRVPTVSRMVDAIVACMSQAVPDHALAAYGGSLAQPVWRGLRQDATGFIFIDTTHGGLGGRRGLDGESCISFPYDVGNHPVEYVEANYPVRIGCLAIRDDSEGPGEFRGGFGAVKEYEMLVGDVDMHVDGDRLRFPPFGLEGGGEAACQEYLLVRDGVTTALRSKHGYAFERGDVLRVLTPGGGGLGPPRQRAPEAVAADVVAGYVDRDRAREVYGVVVDEHGVVDEEATAVLRRLEPATSTSAA